MEEKKANEVTEEVKKEDSPWQTIGIGLLMIALAIYIYYQFDTLEKEGGSIRINRILALIYKFGGKWPGPIILAIIGAYNTFGGIKDLMAKKESLTN